MPVITRVVSAATAVVSASAFLMFAVASPSFAEGTCTEYDYVEVDGEVTYTCVKWDGGGDVLDDAIGGGGTGEGEMIETPTCEFDGRYDELCIGEDACWMNDPAVVQEPSELEGTPKPDEDSHAIYISCQRPDGSTYDRWYWSGDAPVVTLEDRIRSATGALDIPTFSASFNPPDRTLVNLPTWWWAEGAPAGEIRGSEALGLVAFATPRGLSVVPGDGSASIACPMSVTKSETCSHRYVRAGDYTAVVSIVYDLRFEDNGQVLDTSQVPEGFRTITVEDEVPVRVTEIQTRVTEVR